MLGIDHLAALLEQHRGDWNATVREFAIGQRHFAFNSRPAVMGVINLSPDSWYRESVCLTTDAAIQRGRVLAAQGADIIDIGAESTLAHAARVNAEDQRARLLPIVEELSRSGVNLSVETYRAEVAVACLEAGAKVLNLTGNDGLSKIYPIAAEREAALILCYVQGPNVRDVSELKFAKDPVSVMRDYFERQAELALNQGVQKIIIDPGLGFYYRNLQDSATRVRFQMDMFLNTFRLRSLGFPVCHALPHAFEYFGDEVRSAEGFFACLAALGKTDIFRTHEVPKIKAVLNTLELR